MHDKSIFESVRYQALEFASRVVGPSTVENLLHAATEIEKFLEAEDKDA